MSDLNTFLNLGPYATRDQVQAAYNQRVAELISLESSDPAATEKLRQLETAYAEYINQNKLAVPPSQPTRPPQDPTLNLVGTLNQPIQIDGQVVEYLSCPKCGAQNPAQATNCSSCGQQISRPCPNCGKPILLNQPVCSRCGTVVREQDQIRLGEALHTGQRVTNERIENKVRVDALEAGHRARLNTNIFIIIAIVIGFLLLCVLSAWAAGWIVW